MFVLASLFATLFLGIAPNILNPSFIITLVVALLFPMIMAVMSAFSPVFAYNVQKAGGGQFGAINGMWPDGRVDHTCLQSEEMWLGTTYSLVAGMLQEHLVELAFATARGAHLTIYQDYGLWFRTPAAITLTGVHRAVGYMRPLAIWAMQWAWEMQKSRLLQG